MHIYSRRFLYFILFFLCSTYSLLAKDFILLSPDNKIKGKIVVDEKINYALYFNGINYILPSSISMNLSRGKILGVNPEILKTAYSKTDNILKPQYGINKEIHEKYNELRIDFKGAYTIVFRMYNEGFAWRFVTNINCEIIVQKEQHDINFSDNYEAYFHPALSESFYRKQQVSDNEQRPNYSSLPVLVKPNNEIGILIHEADVLDYPCMTLQSNPKKKNSLTSNCSLYPKNVVPGGYNNFNLVVKDTYDYIAKTTGIRSFPWRVVAFTHKDKGILNNELIYMLASPSKLKDAAWVRPGKVAWDWWNALNLTGVPFKTGFNTETYKYFIDFAAKNKIEYVNMDAGWSDQFNLLKVTNKINMEEIAQYAKSKGVRLFLWCVWWVLDKQMKEAFAQFKNWNIAGVKVDFMDRDDQVVVDFQERLLAEAAKNHILVNYHGAYHPTGMQRTYPNNINVEGVRGLEWNKFDSSGTTPAHAVAIPFIRMFAGSMDYTPGAMTNYNKKDWRQINDRPSSMGTRCQQLAMYVVYYAPLQMLSDAPTAYEKESDCLQFLANVPTTWDKTIPLDGRVSEFVAVARKKNNDWYVGAMTNWEKRSITINCDFLDDGKKYVADIFTDGANAQRNGNDYILTRKEISKATILNISMAEGGGYAMKISPINSQTENKTTTNYNIIMFGNSLIENGGDWNKRLNRTAVRNSGSGGFTTSHFVWLLSDAVIKYHPLLCFLEGGINDIGVGIPLERIYANYQSMVDTLLSKKIEPVLQAVLYVNQDNEKENAEKAQSIDAINQFLKRLASSRGICYIDLNGQLCEKKRLKKEYSVDGVHINQDAYKIWAAEIETVLKSKKIQ